MKGLGEPDSLSTSGRTLANSLTFLEGVFLSVKWAVIIVPSSMGRKGLHELFHATQLEKFLARSYLSVYYNYGVLFKIIKSLLSSFSCHACFQ